MQNSKNKKYKMEHALENIVVYLEMLVVADVWLVLNLKILQLYLLCILGLAKYLFAFQLQQEDIKLGQRNSPCRVNQ